jgi:uncharacterized protein (DUF488 family)
MEVSTIGFTKKSAREFFDTLRRAGIRQLIDVRLNNVSQLAGFTKKADLEYFLREIGGISYRHEPLLAPTQSILDQYKKRRGDWTEYERQFLSLMSERCVERHYRPDLFATPSVLLCSEPTAEHCHRRLVAEYFKLMWGNMDIIHL